MQDGLKNVLIVEASEALQRRVLPALAERGIRGELAGDLRSAEEKFDTRS